MKERITVDIRIGDILTGVLFLVVGIFTIDVLLGVGIINEHLLIAISD